MNESYALNLSTLVNYKIAEVIKVNSEHKDWSPHISHDLGSDEYYTIRTPNNTTEEQLLCITDINHVDDLKHFIWCPTAPYIATPTLLVVNPESGDVLHTAIVHEIEFIEYKDGTYSRLILDTDLNMWRGEHYTYPEQDFKALEKSAARLGLVNYTTALIYGMHTHDN